MTLKMLDRVIEQAREEEAFSREDTPTETRVEAAFLYHAGLLYRRVERVVGRSHEAVRQWYRRLAHLFDPEPDYLETVAVDETKVNVEDKEVYVWAAVDVDTFEVVHIRGVSRLIRPRCVAVSQNRAEAVSRPASDRCRSWSLVQLGAR